MYAPTYPFAQGGGAGVSNAQQSGYNPNALSAPPSAQQHLAQPPQHMMYNSQQYGPGPHQSPYGGMGASPGMMQNNNGMAHMPANNGLGQGYQTPYTSSPYGQGIPNSTGPLQQTFMTTTSNNAQFGMNPGSMTPQHQQQRMQPPQVSTPIPSAQRVSPYGGAQHNTPPQAQSQSQYMTPQNQVSNQSHQAQNTISTQNPNVSQTQQGQGQQTPQTPNFPPNPVATAGNNTAVSTPLSPGSESREKERVTLLLDINRELLLEVMRLQAIQAETKKEAAAISPTTDTQTGETKPSEKPSAAATGKEFVECMRRLQANLAYLAAIADRSHKPSSQIPPHPAIISAPHLSTLASKSQVKSPKASSPTTKKESSPGDGIINGNTTATDASGSEEAEDRAVTLKALYAQLQALFPGVDPKKEPPLPSTTSKTAAQKNQTQRPNPDSAQNQAKMGNAAMGALPQHQAGTGQMMAGSVMPQAQTMGLGTAQGQGGR